MTTVAFDGRQMASDSRQVGAYIDNHQARKLYKVNGARIGVAGELQQVLVFLKWYRNQTRPRPDPEHMKDFEALVIRQGKAYYTADLCEMVEVGIPCAIGSGGPYVMAAMIAGASASESVRIAMKLDPYTGGRVRTLSI